MRDFTFDMTLTAAITVKAATAKQARAELLMALDCANTNFGAFKSGNPILGECSVHPESLELGSIDGNPPPPKRRTRKQAAKLAAERGKGTLIGKGQRFELYDDDPHGFRIVRLSDGAAAQFHGDDSCERFRDKFGGDESPDDDISDNAGPTDDVGDWAETEGEFIY